MGSGAGTIFCQVQWSATVKMLAIPSGVSTAIGLRPLQGLLGAGDPAPRHAAEFLTGEQGPEQGHPLQSRRTFDAVVDLHQRVQIPRVRRSGCLDGQVPQCCEVDLPRRQQALSIDEPEL